ncbi:uncharacterized protein EI97DRAFT_462884 [Westerdykella ornata]|uniref:Uncharacterized protein n=1 Tax=Westerdykella ornata TaxID=318751 RepID=A0A6A6J4S2_WESOR|nr:uncharacterized protein EI97DRAFT_462884 [Westerdykella ornata]KAF2271392.1 hypothetical protein EI97DRAFT_462884 [Westerdykella ornata]
MSKYLTESDFSTDEEFTAYMKREGYNTHLDFEPEPPTCPPPRSHPDPAIMASAGKNAAELLRSPDYTPTDFQKHLRVVEKWLEKKITKDNRKSLLKEKGADLDHLETLERNAMEALENARREFDKFDDSQIRTTKKGLHKYKVDDIRKESETRRDAIKRKLQKLEEFRKRSPS